MLPPAELDDGSAAAPAPDCGHPSSLHVEFCLPPGQFRAFSFAQPPTYLISVHSTAVDEFVMSAASETGNLVPSKRNGAAARWSDSWPRQALILIGVAVVYFGAAKLGLTFAYIHTHVSPIWPPTGIAIAAVLLFGNRVAPAIFVGAFLANANAPVNVAAALGIAFGNTLEAVVANWLLRVVKFHISFGRARDVFKFVIVALLCTTVSATIGTLSLCVNHAAQWSQFGSLWTTWWLGDVAGAVTVAPLLIAWRNALGHRSSAGG